LKKGTLQPTASKTWRITMVAIMATVILGLSSLMAGQKVITSTDPERHKATTMENHLSLSLGIIHNICYPQRHTNK